MVVAGTPPEAFAAFVEMETEGEIGGIGSPEAEAEMEPAGVLQWLLQMDRTLKPWPSSLYDGPRCYCVQHCTRAMA